MKPTPEFFRSTSMAARAAPATHALLVGRVSRGERAQDPESQLGPLRAVAARLGWVRAGELGLKLSAWDEHEAGRVWEQVVAQLQATHANVLAVWSLDRLSRGGIEDAFRKVRYLEQHLGVHFYSLQEPFLSTATADAQTRELLLGVLAWAAKWESQRRSERVRARVQSKRRRAADLGERALWGRGRLASEREVERVWALSAAGEPIRAIALATGLSKSQVGRILSVPPQAAGQATAPPDNAPPSTGGGLGQPNFENARSNS